MVSNLNPSKIIHGFRLQFGCLGRCSEVALKCLTSYLYLPVTLRYNFSINFEDTPARSDLYRV